VRATPTGQWCFESDGLAGLRVFESKLSAVQVNRRVVDVANLRLEELQKKYAAEGLQTLSISLDDEVDEWKKAMKSLPIDSIQGRIKSEEMPGLGAVPAYWLLDSTGKLLDKCRTLAELEKALDTRGEVGFDLRERWLSRYNFTMRKLDDMFGSLAPPGYEYPPPRGYVKVETPEGTLEVLDPYPDTSLLMVDTEEPVDNLHAEKQQRLLCESLHGCWKQPKGLNFQACCNVGLFYDYDAFPVVPDMMLAVGVPKPDEIKTDSDVRSYFVWIQGKPPDVAIEFVSDKRGKEDSLKLLLYAKIKVPNYIIFDPEAVLSDTILRQFRLDEKGVYQRADGEFMQDVGLGIRVVEGSYENLSRPFMRWFDESGNMIPTTKERADAEAANARAEARRARAEARRANAEAQRANTEAQRADAAERELAMLKEQMRLLKGE
jgi:hypothetical protein